MNHFHGLTPEEHERLSHLLEELAEAQQAICKILRHGWESTYPDTGETNRQALERELGQVSFTARQLLVYGDLDNTCITLAQEAKHSTAQKWYHHTVVKDFEVAVDGYALECSNGEVVVFRGTLEEARAKVDKFRAATVGVDWGIRPFAFVGSRS